MAGLPSEHLALCCENLAALLGARAIERTFGQHRHNQLRHTFRKLGGKGRRDGDQVLVHEHLAAFIREGGMTAGKLIEDDSQGVDIGGPGDPLRALPLFRSHIQIGAQNVFVSRGDRQEAIGTMVFGQPKIDQIGVRETIVWRRRLDRSE